MQSSTALHCKSVGGAKNRCIQTTYTRCLPTRRMPMWIVMGRSAGYCYMPALTMHISPTWMSSFKATGSVLKRSTSISRGPVSVSNSKRLSDGSRTELPFRMFSGDAIVLCPSPDHNADQDPSPSPTTTRGILKRSIAPVHIAHGASIVNRVQSVESQREQSDQLAEHADCGRLQ